MTTDTPAINIQRGLCRDCGCWIDLTKGGKLRSHQYKGAKCSGVRPVAKARLFVAEFEFTIKEK